MSVSVAITLSKTDKSCVSKDIVVISEITKKTTKSKNPITIAEISDIQNFDSDENNRIFIKIYDDIVSEIVIVK